jgi:hypothetical protein
MATSLGSLVVSLGLNAAEYIDGLNKANYQAQQFQKNIERVAKEAAGILGTYLSARIVKDFVEGIIDANDHLNDLSKKTGIAADTLGGIAFAAKQAGLDLESVAAGTGKLNRSLADAAAGNEKAQQAFTALGISYKDGAGNVKSADAALTEIATKFASYADGPNKVALAVRLFGKAGADMIPLLDEGGAALQRNIEYFKRYSGVTTETAQQADEFNDTVDKLKLLSGAFGQTLVAELLPPMQRLAELFLDAKEKGGGFKDTASGIVDVIKATALAADYGAEQFLVYGRLLGAVGAAADRVAHGDLAGARQVFREFSADNDKARERILALKAALDGTGAAVRQASDDYSHEGRNRPAAKQQAPGLPDLSGADKANAELKKTLDGQIKLIQAFGQQQRDGYAFAQQYVDVVYSRGLESLQEYFDQQKAIREAGLASQLAEQDKIIAAEQVAAARTTNVVDRIDAENKIREAREKRNAAVLRFTQQEVIADQVAAVATEQLGDRYRDLTATILKMTGDDAGAAQIRIAQQVRDAQRLIIQAGGDQATVKRFSDALQATEQLTEAQRRYSELISQTGNREARIYADAALGAKGELETLAEVRDSRRAAIEQLAAMTEQAQALAEALGTPEAKKFADDLATSLKKARAELDPLAQRLNGVFENSASNAFADFITGTKSAADAFRSFATAVIGEIAKIAAADLAKAIFGQNAGQGGIGGFLSGLFGGGASGGTGVGGGGGFAAPGGTAPLAVGMDYVPYDGFRATLHQGERVVPARENMGRGAVINISQQIPADVQASVGDDGAINLIIARAAAQGARMGYDRMAADLGSGTGKGSRALKSRGVSLSGTLARRDR